MDAVTPKRRSRWKKPPVIKEDGSQHVATFTENDAEICKLLVPGSDLRRPWGYHALRSHYISALLGRDHTTVRQRLDLLSSSPNSYLYLPEQPRNNFRHLIYGLDDKGAKEIGAKKPKHSKNFRHELMQCDIAASIELGAKENPSLKIIPWSAIRTSDRFPAHTRKLTNPLYIPLPNKEALRADWEPFVIAFENGNGPKTFYPGFEADCGTEPLDATDPDRSSIRKKFRDYLTIIDQKIYTEHFGANTFMVPFLTMSEARKQSMLALLEEMIGEGGYPAKYARLFGFKSIPGFYDTPMPATGWAVTEPFERVGFPDFYIGK